MWIKLLLVALGGGAGAAARYAIASWGNRPAEHLPLGTVAVNLLGCLAIGAAMGLWGGSAGPEAERWRLLVAVGFLGGFTTFSAFAYEAFAAGADGRLDRAFLNVAISTVGGLALVWAGYRLAERLAQPSG